MADEGTEDLGVEDGSPDPFEDTQIQQFDRGYVEKLRREAADHRTARRGYEKAFEGWTEEDKEVWLDTVRMSTQAPGAAAERLRQIANLLSPEEIQEIIEEAEGDPKLEQYEDRSGFLTKEQLEARLREERDQQEVEMQVKEIQREAEGLGYKTGTESYFRLMWVANNQTKGNLEKAHEAIEADRQKVIDDYIAQKQEQALGPRAVRRGSVAVSTEKPIKTFADAREALEAHIRAMK